MYSLEDRFVDVHCAAFLQQLHAVLVNVSLAKKVYHNSTDFSVSCSTSLPTH